MELILLQVVVVVTSAFLTSKYTALPPVSVRAVGVGYRASSAVFVVGKLT